MWFITVDLPTDGIALSNTHTPRKESIDGNYILTRPSQYRYFLRGWRRRFRLDRLTTDQHQHADEQGQSNAQCNTVHEQTPCLN
jgi:hypothetical protein